GQWYSYDHNGHLVRFESYKENIPADSVEFYSDQDKYVRPETRVADVYDVFPNIEYLPSAEGIWTEYFLNGDLRSEKTYINGIMKYLKEYHENGQLKSEGATIAATDYSNYPIKASYDPD